MPMNWKNLSKNQCPKCNRLLNPDHNTMAMVKCGGICDFKISYGKLIDLSKGTESLAYMKKVKVNKSIDRYKEKIAIDKKIGYLQQQLERESNLRRMKAKELLSTSK